MTNSRFRMLHIMQTANRMPYYPHLKTFYYICIIAVASILSLSSSAHAVEIYKSSNAELSLDLTGAVAGFNSVRSYAGASLTKAGSQTWFQGYGIYGPEGSFKTAHSGEWYGAFKVFTGASQGSPDAAGLSVGDEYQTQIEDGYIGWRSNDLIPWFGHDGLKISAGRQNFTLGSGFLINNDTTYVGKGLAPGFERGGGTTYLAGRSSFSNTVVIDIGSDTGLHFKGFWLRSDNKFQAEETLAGTNLEYIDSKYGTVGATYLRGLHVNRYSADIMGNGYREGQNIWAAYGNTSLGVKQLNISAEYVREATGQYRPTNRSNGRGHAWFASIGWTFNNIAWTPTVTYRFTRFSRHYDPMFYGPGPNLGTWYQGEVASTYAGPFSTASNIQFVQVTVSPAAILQLGVNYFNFNATPNGDLNGHEVDLYAWWTVGKWFTVLPLVGLYDPHKSVATGGTQFGSSGTNVYSEILIFFSF